MTEGTPMRQTAAALVGALSALASTATAASPADTYPSRIVKMIVPFPAGGTTDIFARHIGDRLAKAFGHNFVIDNRGGAGGNIGSDAVAKADPDGYTLLMGTVGTHAINSSLYPRMPFDPVKDFAPVAFLAGVPNVLVVNPKNVKATTVQDFIAEAKADAEEAQLRLLRQRHLDPSLGRDVQADDRGRARARALSRLGAGRERPHRRAGRPDVRQPAVLDRAGAGRQPARHRGDLGEALGGAAGRADDRRVGAAGLRRLELVCDLRAGKDPARDRRRSSTPRC